MGGYGAGPGEEEEDSYYVSHGLAGVDEKRAVEAVQEAVALLGSEIIEGESYGEPADFHKSPSSSSFLDRLETDSGIASLAFSDSEDDLVCSSFLPSLVLSDAERLRPLASSSAPAKRRCPSASSTTTATGPCTSSPSTASSVPPPPGQLGRVQKRVGGLATAVLSLDALRGAEKAEVLRRATVLGYALGDQFFLSKVPHHFHSLPNGP